MNHYKLKIFLFALLMTSPLAGFAKFPGILSRFQVGYTFVSNQAEYSSSFKTGFLNIDTSFPGYEMKTSASFGVTAGTYFPLARLGNSSALVLGVDFMYNAMTWDSKIPGILDNSNFSMKFDGVTAQMALPVGLDFKFGADAIQARDRRFCATLGGGVFPSYSATALNNTPMTIEPVFSVAPYVKAEVGIYAGICMKVRAIYAIGDVVYMDYKKSDNTGGIRSESTSKLTSNSNLSLSLLIMPFSYKWQKAEWWNTY